eukprot:TRINITY_DN5938_c0_g1_i1.p1 TRINITY_DN5938_c0_g1~~TRINITY_DN5938_c0_g1_i1.p1  ORF type:complete len:448 (-),score=43.35 TRINITY_DN5938_c0_g1_i1:168-1511(-)
MRHTYLYSLALLTALAVVAVLVVPSQAGVIVRQQNSSYALLETSYMLFELNRDTWHFTVKLPGGNLGADVGSRLLGFDHKVRFRHNQGACVDSAGTYPVVNLTTSVTPSTLGDVTEVTLSGYSGPGNLCRLALVFYFVNAPITVNQSGLPVVLNPNDIKYSYEVSGCTSLQTAVQSTSFNPSWDPNNITVIGRTAGPAVEVFGITKNPFNFLKSYDGIETVNGTDILKWWDDVCASNVTGLGGLLAAPPGFNFSREAQFVIQDSQAGYDYTIAIRYLRWAYSDNGTYTVPGLPFDVTGLFPPTSLGNGLAAWSFRFGVRTQFHTHAVYDPSFTLETLFDLSAGEPPKTTSAAPAVLAIENGVNLGAAVGASVAVVAVLVIVGLMFMVRPIRRKILPYSATRVRTSLIDQNPLPDDSAPAEAPQTDPQSVQSPRWSTANTRNSMITNT